MNTYAISVSRPAPSMGSQHILFGGTYTEACNEARRLFALCGRSVVVRSGSLTNGGKMVYNPSSFWFRISRTGEVDKNTVPAKRAA